MEGLTLKQRLAQKTRKLVKTVELDGDKVDLRRPSHKERIAVLKLMEDAGEMQASKANATEGSQASSTEGGLRGMARMVACVLYDPESKLRLYDPADTGDVDTILSSPWLEDVTLDAQKAFMGGLKESVEEARGNS